jgi:hypothetical protein
VIAALLVITNLPRGQHRDVTVHYSSSTATPGPAQNPDALPTPETVFGGNAPWALAALPECFHQDSRRSGTPAFARVHFPANAVPVSPGMRLRVADCTLDVEARTGIVVRGDNRLVIPALARFFIAGRTLVLDHIEAGREDVRTYSLHGETTPTFNRIK